MIWAETDHANGDQVGARGAVAMDKIGGQGERISGRPVEGQMPGKDTPDRKRRQRFAYESDLERID